MVIPRIFSRSLDDLEPRPEAEWPGWLLDMLGWGVAILGTLAAVGGVMVWARILGD